ncbi:MAG: zinc ribbon domain-containing protein, partial [Thermoplasmata archaeon]|nr:zinc ribbon domain-containing protein [Thermoplasmata archaeon]
VIVRKRKAGKEAAKGATPEAGALPTLSPAGAPVAPAEVEVLFECTNCGKLVDDDASKCPHCGAEFEEGDDPFGIDDDEFINVGKGPGGSGGTEVASTPTQEIPGLQPAGQTSERPPDPKVNVLLPTGGQIRPPDLG